MKPSAVARLFTLLMVGTLGLGAAPAAAVDGSDQVLVLGRISDDPNRHQEQLRPLLDYVVARMADLGIREGRVLMAPDTAQMVSYLRRGRVDWVTETAATGLLLAERSGARVLVATERNGVSMYRSVIFTRRDSGIGSLADLRGRSIAFQNLNSTSAYFAPAAALLQAGLPLEILLSPDDLPRPAAVGYLFARSEHNIATWVHKRLVDAGAVSEIDWDALQRLPHGFRDELTPIHRSGAYPRALELVRGGFGRERRERLRAVLLAAADDPTAREPLLRFFGTGRFLPIDAPMQASLAQLAREVQQVRAALE